MEKTTVIRHDGLKLEAALEFISDTRGVVITHPHPLYGGDMDNPVVMAIRDGYQRMGFTTLRFNFRGVGQSLGEYDNGMGEQEDVRAAVLYLSNQGICEIHLAGYSFGAWVNAKSDTLPVTPSHMLMVAPPVAFMDFSTITGIHPPLSIIAGARDEIAPPDQIRALMKRWSPDAVLDIIQGADHFSLGSGNELQKRIVGLGFGKS